MKLLLKLYNLESVIISRSVAPLMTAASMLIVCLACLQSTGSSQNDLPQCQLLMVQPPTTTGRVWIPTDTTNSLTFQIKWQTPPEDARACNISATSFDTSVVRVVQTQPFPGTVSFGFEGIRAGSTAVEISLGAFNAPKIRVAATAFATLNRTIAHRGAGSMGPENTLSSLRLAAQFPTPGVEFDVRLTRDSVPILMHDENTIRTTGFIGLVSQLSFLQTQQLNAASYFSNHAAPEPPPALLDVLSFLRYTSVPLVLAEIKHDDAFTVGLEVRSVLDVVKRSGIGNRLVLYSTSPAIITELRAADSTIRLGYSQNRYQSTQRAFLSQRRVEFMFYPGDSILHGDTASLDALRTDGVKLIGYTTIGFSEADSLAGLPDTYALGDSIPSLFAIPLPQAFPANKKQ